MDATPTVPHAEWALAEIERRKVARETKERADHEIQQRTTPDGQIAARRYQAEIAGIDLGGMRIDTGRDSQGLIAGAALAAVLDPLYSVRWKTPAGFIDLTAEQIIGVVSAVRAHVQACFDREAELLVEIENGTLTPEMLEEGWPNEPVSEPAPS